MFFGLETLPGGKERLFVEFRGHSLMNRNDLRQVQIFGPASLKEMLTKQPRSFRPFFPPCFETRIRDRSESMIFWGGKVEARRLRHLPWVTSSQCLNKLCLGLLWEPATFHQNNATVPFTVLPGTV